MTKEQHLVVIGALATVAFGCNGKPDNGNSDSGVSTSVSGSGGAAGLDTSGMQAVPGEGGSGGFASANTGGSTASGGIATAGTGSIANAGTSGIADASMDGASVAGTGGIIDASISGADAAGTGGDPGPVVTFRNPLNRSHGSDPWMLYYNGYYYLAATTWGDTLTMKRGRTIQELKEAETKVIWRDSNEPRCCKMWAPEFHLLDGRWYMYYTAGNSLPNNSPGWLDGQRSHVLQGPLADDPMGPMGNYTYAGRLLDSWAIDGSILEVNGIRYFMYSAWDGPQNIYAIQMSSPTSVSGNAVLLSTPQYEWEREGTASVNEGPEPLYHDGRIFVVYSASQCADPGYKLGLLELTGTNPLSESSWKKYGEPVFEQANGAFGTGHNGFFTSPDGTENWIVYHATTIPEGNCWIERTTRIQRFDWNADGTPNFGVPFSLDTEIIVPSGQ